MTATIAGIAPAGVITIITRLQRNTDSKSLERKQKGEPGGSPFAFLLCRLGSALEARMFRERRAPQKRCDQLWCSSKPGGVMVPPELLELTSRLYSSNPLNASEQTENAQFPQRLCSLEISNCYLMKSVSRSWSRPTNDFIVRKRTKRSWISRF